MEAHHPPLAHQEQAVAVVLVKVEASTLRAGHWCSRRPSVPTTRPQGARAAAAAQTGLSEALGDRGGGSGWGPPRDEWHRARLGRERGRQWRIPRARWQWSWRRRIWWSWGPWGVGLGWRAGAARR